MGTQKNKSLLEVAIEVIKNQKNPVTIEELANSPELAALIKKDKDILAQFYVDFMCSGYFVYCGNDKWDLKSRQPTAVLDRDGIEGFVYTQDEDIDRHELGFKEAQADQNEESKEEDLEDINADEGDDGFVSGRDLESEILSDDDFNFEAGVEAGFEEDEGDEDDEEE